MWKILIMDLEILADLIEYNQKKLYYERINYMSVLNNSDLLYEDKLAQISSIIDRIISYNNRIDFISKIIKENSNNNE